MKSIFARAALVLVASHAHVSMAAMPEYEVKETQKHLVWIGRAS